MNWLIEWITLEVKVMMIAALPVIELRGSIPFGVAQGLSPFHAMFISVLGGIVPVPFILLMIRPILSYLHKQPLFSKFVSKLTHSTLKNKAKIQKYGFWGLIIIVAIPLPGTGVWSGSLAAALLDLRMKTAVPAIFIGNFIAGMIVLAVSYGVLVGVGG